VKFNAASLKKLVRNRDTWVVIGGAAAAVTAFAVVSGRGSSSAPSFAYPGLDDTSAGSGDSGSNPGDGAPAHASDPMSDFGPVTWPTAVSRPAAAPVPSSSLPPSPAFVDRLGNPATVDQIMAQHFDVAAPVATAQLAPSAPVRSASIASIVKAPASFFVDRTGNRVTLEELMGQSFFTNSDARQAPPVSASGSAYSVPAPAPLFVEPIVARNIKTPGGALAYPGGGVETYIGGGASPLGGSTQALLAS
jgi:hypothetical protein